MTFSERRANWVRNAERPADLVPYSEISQEEGAPLLACFPRPASCFGTPPWSQAFAVSGGCILGGWYSWDGTLFHDTVMKVGGYDYFELQPWRDSEGRVKWWLPMGRHFETNRELGTHRDAPAMLPLAGGGGPAVVRMDTVLFDGAYCFEVLRLLPGGGCCHATPMPKPPIGRVAEHDVFFVSAYFAVGTRVWISVTGKGTFSFDAGEHGSGAWRIEGPWQLPFEGRALHVPELGSAVIGLAAETRLLCAYDFSPEAPPVMRHVWRETFPGPSEECADSLRPRDMATLAYLGEGRFCICRPMSTRKPAAYARPPVLFNAGSFSRSWWCS